MTTLPESYQQGKYWYHASPNQFDQFDVSRSDLGPHFGNMQQAIYVIQNRLNGNGTLYKTRIKVSNPLSLKDVGSFHADNIADQLLRKKIISKQDYIKYNEKDAWKHRKQYNQEVRDKLLDQGYDGVRYQNNHEGSGVCVIPFDSSDITIVGTKQYQNNEISEELIRCLKLAGITENNTVEPITYTMPNFHAEYEEATRYDNFKGMSPEEWVNFAKKGKIINITQGMLPHINNTDATSIESAKQSFNALEPDKIKRFHQSLKSSTIEMPIIFDDGGHYELLGGNTRLTGLVANGVMPKVWLINQL